MNFQP